MAVGVREREGERKNESIVGIWVKTFGWVFLYFRAELGLKRLQSFINKVNLDHFSHAWGPFCKPKASRALNTNTLGLSEAAQAKTLKHGFSLLFTTLN